MREASIHLSNAELDAFGLTEFVAVFRDAGLQEVNELSCQRPGCLLAITVTDHISEDQLSALSEVEWWEQLDGDSGVTYLCKLSVPAFDEGFDPHHETDTARESMTVTDEGVTITMVGDHESVRCCKSTKSTGRRPTVARYSLRCEPPASIAST
jgi:hypothetical protein